MELLEEIEAFIENARMSPSRFGRICAGDPRLVGDMRAGRRLRYGTEERIRRFLLANPISNVGGIPQG